MIDVAISQAQAQAYIDAHDRIVSWLHPTNIPIALAIGLGLLLSGETPTTCTCAGLCGHRAARMLQCEDARRAANVADDGLFWLLHREAIAATGAAVEQKIQLIERATRTLLCPRPSQTLPAWDRPALAA